MSRKSRDRAKAPKPRDPAWEYRRALGHKVKPSAKRYARHKMEKITPRTLGALPFVA